MLKVDTYTFLKIDLGICYLLLIPIYIHYTYYLLILA